MKKTWILVALAVTAFVTGVILTNSIANRLTQRGLEADANGTSGYTTNAEWVMLGGGLFLIFAAFVFTVLALIALLRSRLKEPPVPVA